MTRPRKIVMGIAGLAFLVVLALGASTLVVSNDYPTEQTAVLSFELPDDFGNVRGILVRTDATKQIIILARDNEFIEDEWTTIGGGLDSIAVWKDWRLELKGKLKVRSLDEYIGQPIVLLKQVVKITADEVLSDIDLEKPTERLWKYHLITHYVRDEKTKTTRVDLRLTQEILTTAPWFAHWIADDRVYASAAAALEHQQRAIRELIAENRDKKWRLLGR